ncbi:uncharacterized protein [Lepeophtheirus salmonis]|uniref:uncharacterized protein isoform X1 n=1 Tax=Lepeophtheirus salmonis TaxID=72036 RepID=UPI001AE25515|nr:zinc finger protein 62 homolog [Lepeophtheirus salmonis]
MSIEEGETANEVIIKEEVLEEPESFSPENIIVESDDTFLFPFNEKVKAVYSCCFCPVKLSTMEETLSHCGDEHAGFDVVVKIKPGPIVTIKSSLNELSCVDCKTDHVTVEEMSSHVNYHTHLVHSQSRTNNKKILRQTCSICKVGFIDKYRLRSHYASAHPNNSIFECKKCSQIFHKCSEYLKHKLYSHKKRPVNPDRLYDCDLCEKKFREKSLLDRHYARDHLHRKYICDICEKEFDMQRYLTKHKARVHPESFDYVCEFCGKKFAINEYLNSHKKICKFRSPKQMNEDNDFQCSKCGKCFTNEIFLLNHSAMVHDKKRKDNHCVTCDKYFVNPISLRHHMSTHDENRPKYSCDFCNKEYLSKSTLHFHVLSNHSTKAPDKTFKCDYCDWSFWENKRLRSHVKHVHNKVRDYKCDICDRAFGCKRHLIRHKTTIHEKFREFKCHLCSVEYFQKISLKNHLKKIHLVTDYMPPKQTKEI